MLRSLKFALSLTVVLLTGMAGTGSAQSVPPTEAQVQVSLAERAGLRAGDRIVAAVQEERLVGKKRARLYGSRPSLAVQYCLAQGGIGASDLDMVVICAQSALDLPGGRVKTSGGEILVRTKERRYTGREYAGAAFSDVQMDIYQRGGLLHAA